MKQGLRKEKACVYALVCSPTSVEETDKEKKKLTENKRNVRSKNQRKHGLQTCLPAGQPCLVWKEKDENREKNKAKAKKVSTKKKDKRRWRKKRKRRQKENKRESARHLQSPENASDHMRKRNRTKGNTITNIQPETLKRNITSDGPTQAHKTPRGGGNGCLPTTENNTNWHQYSKVPA